MVIIIKDSTADELAGVHIPREIPLIKYGDDILFGTSPDDLVGDIEKIVKDLRRSGWCVDVNV